MKSAIKSEIMTVTRQPQLYELGLGVFVICFILTSLLFWQYTHPAISQPTYYTLQENGQITPVAATIDLNPQTEVLGEAIER